MTGLQGHSGAQYKTNRMYTDRRQNRLSGQGLEVPRFFAVSLMTLPPYSNLRVWRRGYRPDEELRLALQGWTA
jgi:hypothetical protein